MSGLVSAIGSTLGWGNEPDPDNEVMIEVGKTRIAGWESVLITRSAEAIPNQFVLSASFQYPQDLVAATPLGKDQAKVYIGKDLVITGWVDRFEIVTGAQQHEVTVTGRGLCQDLVDCSADLAHSPDIKNGYVSAKDILDLATRLAKPFGLSVRLVGKDHGREIPGFQVALGETPYEVIERVARYAGFLVYEDEKGALVLDRVGTEAMASGFAMPGNVEGGASILSIDQRYSIYTIVQNAVAQYADVNPLSGLLAEVKDDKIPRNRPLIIVSEQVMPGRDFAKERAEWEKARRIGRSQAFRLTCDNWRDSANKLWQPNKLAPIDAAPHRLVKLKWIIGHVVYRKDLSGTHTDVVLMPPEAFSVQPATLNVYDMQITAPPASQAPKPSSPQDPPPAKAADVNFETMGTPPNTVTPSEPPAAPDIPAS